MNITSKAIETKAVKAQASPVHTAGLTPFKVYEAIQEITEYTIEYPLQYSESTYTRTHTESIYVVVDDNLVTRRFGSEFFRQVAN